MLLEFEERIVQAAELVASRYLMTMADIENPIRVRNHVLDMRDSAIEEQAWVRRNRLTALSVDADLMGSYRLLMARLELLAGSAVVHETQARAAGEAIGMVVVGILQVAVAISSEHKPNLERLLRAAAKLASDRS